MHFTFSARMGLISTTPRPSLSREEDAGWLRAGATLQSRGKYKGIGIPSGGPLSTGPQAVIITGRPVRTLSDS